MVVSKIRKPFPFPTRSRPIDGWLWLDEASISAVYAPPAEYVTLGYTFEGYNTTPTTIGNVFVDGIRYAEKNSVAECEAEEKSWYFDFVLQQRYIHIAHGKRVDSSNIDTLAVFGFASRLFYDENDVEYQPYLIGAISIRDYADRLVYNKIAFPGQNLKYLNQDGAFDPFYNNPTQGSDVEYKYMSDSDFDKGEKSLTDIFAGYVYDDGLSRNGYDIKVKDKREQISVKWPSVKFSIIDYPDLEDKFIDDIIPDGYGFHEVNIPAICVNGTTTTGDVIYKYGNEAETSTSPTVQVLIDREWTDTTATYDYVNAEYTVAEADGRDGNGKPYESRVKDINMRFGPANIVDMLKEIMTLGGFPYAPELWDTTKVDSEEATYLTAKATLYANKEKPLFDYIEELQGGGEYGFRLSYGADRKWTIQCDDIHRAISNTYQAVDNRNNIMTVPRDLTEYATSVEVEYAYSPEAKKGLTVLDDSREVAVFNTYRVYQKKSYPSLLKELTDAAAKADHIAEDYAIARGQIKFTLDEIKTHMLYDVVEIDTSVYDRGVKTREYLGVRKIKLSLIEYDFGSESTTLQGYDITEVI